MFLIYRTDSGAGVYTESGTPSLDGLSGLSCVEIPENTKIGPYGCSWNGTRVVDNPAPPVVSPTLAQLAALAMGAGLTLSLSGSIVLGATNFPIDGDTQAKIAAVITTINTTGTFPGGASSYPMKDSAGAWHTFSVEQYKAVAAAISNYVAVLYLIIDGNPFEVSALPSNAVSVMTS